MRTLHAVAGITLTLALTACQTPPSVPAAPAKPSAPAAHSGAVASAAAVPPPSDPVTATLTERASGFTSSRGDAIACEVAAGAITVRRFLHGRYAVDAAACGATKQVWLEKRYVEIADSAYAPLLERVREIPGLVLEMAYAGDQIFCDAKGCLMREPLYGKPRCYLAPATAAKLREAAAALQARDPLLRLRVYDCYRPVDVQIQMFTQVANPAWVAEPKPPRYGGHNRGIAVDFTIERDGVALDMGSAYDLFQQISEYAAPGLGAQAVANRKFLRDLMTGLGLRPYDGEWWHFSLPIDTRAMNFPL